MLFAFVLAASMSAQLGPAHPHTLESSGKSAQLSSSLAQVPVPPTPTVFIRNRGQFPADALFVGRFRGMLVRVERGALALQLYDRGSASDGVLVRMAFEDASPALEAIGEDQQDVAFSYFRGNDPDKWQRDVGAFGAVRLRNLYDGIDLVLREEAGVPKYDLFVLPGADLSRVVIRVQGSAGMCVRSNGAVELNTASGDLLQPAGRGWQIDGAGEKRWFTCKHRLLSESRFGFELPDVDPTKAMVIDPGLVWSTYLGSTNNVGPGDWGWCVDIANNGDVVVAGDYSWPDFPMTPGAYHVVGSTLWDIFVAKLRGSDGALIYSAVLGGDATEERPKAIKFDIAGRATVVGWTTSANFPTTLGAFDRINNEYPGLYDAFVLRLNAMGSDLDYSTYLGGTANEQPYALALAPSGAAIVGGSTGGGAGGPFPTTAGAYQTTPQNLSGVQVGFITRVDPTGSFLEWSTLLGQGAEVHGVALDLQQRVTVTGNTGPPAYFPVTPGAVLQVPPGQFTGPNVFVARLSPNGHSLLWGGVFGGSIEDDVTGGGIDAFGNAYVCGFTRSLDFPTTAGAYQTLMGTPNPFRAAFISCVSASGATLLYSTYLGGSGDDQAYGIAIDPSGVATIAGLTGNHMQATPGAYDTASVGGDAFIARFSPDGTRRIYTTFLGGNATDEVYGMAMTNFGRVAVAGMSHGPGYPTTPGVPGPTFNGGQNDAIASVIDLNPAGINSYGSSTPACVGPLQLQASEMPSAGAASFSLLCSAAPPNANGWLLVAAAASANGVVRRGATLWIDPRHLVMRVPVSSDAQGFIDQPMPALVNTAGAHYFAQFLMASSCAGGRGWTASNALEITTQ